MSHQCKYSAEELNGKTITFRIPLGGGVIEQGDGTLEAKQNADGLLIVQIKLPPAMKQTGPNAGYLEVKAIPIPADALHMLVKNPSSHTEFAMIAG